VWPPCQPRSQERGRQGAVERVEVRPTEEEEGAAESNRRPTAPTFANGRGRGCQGPRAQAPPTVVEAVVGHAGELQTLMSGLAYPVRSRGERWRGERGIDCPQQEHPTP
jgi:hypothetical protein